MQSNEAHRVEYFFPMSTENDECFSSITQISDHESASNLAKWIRKEHQVRLRINQGSKMLDMKDSFVRFLLVPSMFTSRKFT